MTNHYDIFEPENHLKPKFSADTFNQLTNWDFGYELLSLIDVLGPNEDEVELSKRFSPGQKAIYFFWYLDAQVTNGGFIQFYYNGYRQYLPAILQGLDLIGYPELIQLLKTADEEFIKNQAMFANTEFSELYEQLPAFASLDEQYYDMNENAMKLIEQYARNNPEQFAELE